MAQEEKYLTKLIDHSDLYFIRIQREYHELLGGNITGNAILSLFEFLAVHKNKFKEKGKIPEWCDCGYHSYPDLINTLLVCKSRQYIINIIQWLESIGFIRTLKRTGKPNQYFINIHAIQKAIAENAKYIYQPVHTETGQPVHKKTAQPVHEKATVVQKEATNPSIKRPQPVYKEAACEADTLYTKKDHKDPLPQDHATKNQNDLVDFWIEEEAEEEDLHKHSFSSVGIKGPVPSTNTPEEEDAKQVSADQNQTSTKSVLKDPLNALKDVVKDKVPNEHLEGFIAFYLAEVKSRKIKSPLKYLEKAFNDLWIIYASKTTNESLSVHKNQNQKTSKKSTKQTSPVRSNSQYSGACRTTSDNMCTEQDVKPQGETQIGLKIQAKIKERLQKEREDGTLDKVIDRYLI